MTLNTPRYLQNKGFTAKLDRHTIEDIFDGEGVIDPNGFEITYNSNLTLTFGDGRAVVRGDTNTDQGLYLATNIGNMTLDFAPMPSVNPRLDQVILRIYDAQEAGGAYDKVTLEVLTGVETAGASLDNRNGAATLPSSALLLWDVLSTVGDTNLTSSDVRDRRQFINEGSIPTIKTATGAAVSFRPCPALVPQCANGVPIAHAYDTYQTAALFYLPSRIKNATKIRWKYTQDATTAVAGNYIIAIFDSSGRKIVDTGSVAFAGATSTYQIRSETITSTSFDVGLYYVFFGIDTFAGGTARTGGIITSMSAASTASTNAPNTILYATSGGITVPTTILGLTDIQQQSSTITALPVPLITLSQS